MESTEESSKHGSTPLNSRVDHHWVENLFPPHFTLENLLENQTNTGEKYFPGMEEPQRGHRRQLYLTALKEVKHIEMVQKREVLANRIIGPYVNSEEATPKNHADPSPHFSEIMGEKEDTCIWNKRDIDQLRARFAEMARERFRLMHKLSSSEEQLRAEREEKRMLQGLVEELEERLSVSSKKAARQSLVINDFKSDAQKKNALLSKLAIQVREKEEEQERDKTNLRTVKEDLQKSEHKRFNQAEELERIKVQQKTERHRLEKVFQIKNEAALMKLQREVDRLQTELSAEKESHARSQVALDLLRKHFSSQ